MIFVEIEEPNNSLQFFVNITGTLGSSLAKDFLAVFSTISPFILQVYEILGMEVNTFQIMELISSVSTPL